MVVQFKGNTIPSSKGRGGPKVHMACGVSGDAPGGSLASQVEVASYRSLKEQ